MTIENATEPHAEAPDRANAPPPIPPCECGSRHWSSLTRPDGEAKKIARCAACGSEREIIWEAFGATTSRVADPVSPWETQRSSEAELRWYYSQSDGDLGAHSSWEQQVQQAHFGSPDSAAVTMFNGQASAAAMSPQKIWAAKRVTWIRAALATLRRAHQAVLEASFSLHRQDVQLAGLVGQDLEPVVSYLIASGQITVKELTKSRDRRDAVREQAKGLLGAAIGAYEAARAGSKPEPEGKPRGVELKQAGPRGASSRRLIPSEAPAAPWRSPRPV